VKAASLSAALLVAKGEASPSRAGGRGAARGATLEFLPKPARKPPGEDGVTRVSLRMPGARHLRLRLAAAHLGRSNQALMLTAIDHYIDHVLPLLIAGRCACLEQGRAVEGGCAALGFGRTHPDHRP
jgi:predicted DNA-binding protein